MEPSVDALQPPPCPVEGFSSYELNGTVFMVPQRYTNLTTIGAGAFGQVCSAYDEKRQTMVAIKKLLKPFNSTEHAKRTLREVLLLRHLNHDNIIGLSDVFTPCACLAELNDIYLVTQLLGSDLSSVVKSQTLTTAHVKFFVYQMLRGLKYVHSANIIHRDLKPGNMVVNENCDLKIVDFGLARTTDPVMTGYVATRWYRAPEIMLSWRAYDIGVDMWSVGCVMAELLSARPLFPGHDHISQLDLITDIVGTPSAEEAENIRNETAREYVRKMPVKPPVSLRRLFPRADEQAIDLLSKLLVFEPSRRITAAQALEHPFLAEFHDPDDEPEAQPYSDDYENVSLDLAEWKRLVWLAIQEQGKYEAAMDAEEAAEAEDDVMVE